MFDLVSQTKKQEKQETTEKAINNLKVKNSEKPPRREKELSPLSPDLSKNNMTTTSEYQFATLQVAKSQREANRHKSNSGIAHSRPVFSPQGIAPKNKPANQQHYI